MAADWTHDPSSFREKFGITYDEFVEVVQQLSEGDLQKYEDIRAVNLRAAILWAIDQGRHKKTGPFNTEERPKTFSETARAVVDRMTTEDDD